MGLAPDNRVCSAALAAAAAAVPVEKPVFSPLEATYAERANSARALITLAATLEPPLRPTAVR